MLFFSSNLSYPVSELVTTVAVRHGHAALEDLVAAGKVGELGVLRDGRVHVQDVLQHLVTVRVIKTMKWNYWGNGLLDVT